jgi:hypothetical protein
LMRTWTKQTKTRKSLREYKKTGYPVDVSIKI